MLPTEKARNKSRKILKWSASMEKENLFIANVQFQEGASVKRCSFSISFGMTVDYLTMFFLEIYKLFRLSWWIERLKIVARKRFVEWVAWKYGETEIIRPEILFDRIIESYSSPLSTLLSVAVPCILGRRHSKDASFSTNLPLDKFYSANSKTFNLIDVFSCNYVWLLKITYASVS